MIKPLASKVTEAVEVGWREGKERCGKCSISGLAHAVEGDPYGDDERKYLLCRDVATQGGQPRYAAGTTDRQQETHQRVLCTVDRVACGKVSPRPLSREHIKSAACAGKNQPQGLEALVFFSAAVGPNFTVELAEYGCEEGCKRGYKEEVFCCKGCGCSGGRGVGPAVLDVDPRGAGVDEWCHTPLKVGMHSL